MKFLKDIFTSADNSTFSMSKIIGAAGALAMVVQFIRAGSVDFQGLGIALATIIASLAAKTYTDKKE